MERITEAQLNNALTTPEGRLQKRLSSEDGSTLTILLEKTLRRYPNQDAAETIAEYLADFEQLALKYSLLKIEAALKALRIDPQQQFFPKPDEVAGEIERQENKRNGENARLSTAKILDEMARERAKHAQFMREWQESGLSLAEFCTQGACAAAVKQTT